MEIYQEKRMMAFLISSNFSEFHVERTTAIEQMKLAINKRNQNLFISV